MAISTRRDFLCLAAAASAGCVVQGANALAPVSSVPKVRPAAGGQSWRYAKHDYFTGEVVDTQIDRISQIGESIDVESGSEMVEAKPIAVPSWGEIWWRENMGADAARVHGPIEIQRPWGMVVVDSHWSEMQAFEKAIPLWPAELRPGWSTVVRTYYKIPGSEEAMPWEITMDALRWESVTVPAGRFTALRVHNLINFRYSIFAERTAAERIEHLWFVPEIGRWVRRESAGTFHEQLGTQVQESSYRWELLSWT